MSTVGDGDAAASTLLQNPLGTSSSSGSQTLKHEDAEHIKDIKARFFRSSD